MIQRLSAALVTVKSTLAGAISRILRDKMMDLISVKDFGAVGDGITDDTNAIQAAVNSAIQNGFGLYVPSGKYIIKQAILANLGIGHNFKLAGNGSGTTILAFRGNIDGIRAVAPSVQEWDAASVHISGMSLTTDSVEVGTAVYVNQNQVTGIPAGNITLNELQIRGENKHTNQWETGVHFARTTGTTMRDIEIYGYAHSGRGYGIKYEGAADDIVTQHIIDNCRFWFLLVGVHANAYVQGLFFSSCNWFAVRNGIAWNASSEQYGQTELHVVNCQFSVGTTGMNLTRIGFINMNSTMFICDRQNQSMSTLFARFDSCWEVTLTNNNFYGGDSTNNIGIEWANSLNDTNQGNYPSIIYGNIFDALDTGIVIGSNADGLDLRNNKYTISVHTPIANSNPNGICKEDAVYRKRDVITFPTSQQLQTITVPVPKGTFYATPDHVSLTWNGDYVMSANFSIADSTKDTLVFKVRRFDGLAFTGGPFSYSVRASL